MIRHLTTILLTVLFLYQPVLAFDVDKAKENYKNASFMLSSVRESQWENAPAISVNFTVPLAKKYLKDYHVTLDGGGSDHWIISEDRTSLIFPFVSPETEYSVTVSSEIRDVTGRKLGHQATRTLTTRKIQPYIGFSSSGHILSAASPKHLPVTTLNVDEVDIDFFFIEQKHLPAFLRDLPNNGQKQLHRLRRLQQYGNLAHSGRFALEPRRNQRTTYNIDLEEIDNLSAPGVYAAVMKRPGSYPYKYSFAYFMQTDIGLHVRRYNRVFDVYAQDISTGQPMNGIAIRVLDADGDTVENSTTSDMGRARFHDGHGKKWLLAERGSEMAVLRLDMNSLDLSGLKNATTSHTQYQMYAWGPRDLYRPGERVKRNILVRDYDGRAVDSLPLQYTLYKPDGTTAASGALQPSASGHYSFEYQTAEYGKTGRYRLWLAFAGSNTINHYFQVEEFLPERLNLTLFEGMVSEKRLAGHTETIEVPVSSDYLYGAPASGNEVDGFVTAEVDPHPFEHLGEYHFGDPEENITPRREKFDGIELDEEGSGLLAMENFWSETGSPIRLLIDASVYETGGRPVSRRESLTLLPAGHLIGIQPQFNGRPDANSTVAVKLGCVNSQGEWLTGRRLHVSLVRLKRQWYWRHSNSRGWHWDHDETPETVFQQEVRITKQDTVMVNLPLNWGRYRLEVRDGEALSAYEFETGGSWWRNSREITGAKPDLVSLDFEKSAYKPGETARLRVRPPQGGLALITVESSDGVLYSRYTSVDSAETTVNIPIDPSWDRHDLYASAMVIRPGDRKETPVPTRSFGMVHLPLERDHRLYEVDLDAPEKVEPNTTVSAKVSINGTAPLPESTRVVVSLVDVGILNITRFQTPDAAAYFFGKRRYTVDLFDNYGQVIDNVGPKTRQQRFGGGFRESSAQLARGGQKPKSEVMMVSFFSAPLIPNANGEVEARFKLPNFNGRLRWMVMVYSAEKFGQAEADTTVADRLVTQLSMPRFLAGNDSSTVTLDLLNNSGTEQALTVELTTGGGLESSATTRNIILPDGGKEVATFPIRGVPGSKTGQVKLHLINQDGSIEKDRQWRLSMRSPYPSITRSVSAAIGPGSSWRPELVTEDLVPETVRMQLTLADRPPMDYSGHFAYLLRYPYGCLEQSLSSSYPWVLTPPDRVAELGLEDQIRQRFQRDYDQLFRLQQINNGVRRVMDKRKNSGGFGLWTSDNPEQKWLSVYAAEFLHDASRQGGDVDQALLRKTFKRLRDYLRGNYSSRHTRWSSDTDHYQFAFRSYAGYVLAKAGMARLSDLRRLATKYRGKTDDDGLSWMYLAAAFRLTGDEPGAKASFQQAMAERARKEHRYYGEYGSSIRDLARVSELALRHNFGGPELLLELRDKLQARRYLSTQERICLLRIMLAAQQRSQTSWTAALVHKDGRQVLERDTPFNSLFGLGKYKNLRRIETDQTPLYADVSLAGDLREPPAVQANGLQIHRRLYDTKGNPLKAELMRSGEAALVMLEISGEQRTPDGLVVDLLPAGLEIENTNLGHASMRMGRIEIDDATVAELRATRNIKHEEFRDDRYAAAVSIPGEAPIRLFYLVRAVTPGIYQVPPPYVEDMYRPYRFAVGTGGKAMEVFR